MKIGPGACRLIGDDLQCFPLGFGAMSLSGTYGEADDGESIHLLHNILDDGNRLIDTSDFYGWGHNETLVGKALAGRRDEAILATKFGIYRPDSGAPFALNGRPDYVVKACDASLQRLGIDCIDLYYNHRLDPDVPVEETVGAMAELVGKGKVHKLGLSEVSAATLRRAHAVHPIAALQSEYSLWSRDIESEILPACAELGVTLVAYSPLGRGFLTGTMKKDDPGNTHRTRVSERFSGDNFDRNKVLIKKIEGIAENHDASAAQVALAWVLQKQPHAVPIFGTRSLARYRENMRAAELKLGSEEIATLDTLYSEVAGDRYNDALKQTINA